MNAVTKIWGHAMETIPKDGMQNFTIFNFKFVIQIFLMFINVGVYKR